MATHRKKRIIVICIKTFGDSVLNLPFIKYLMTHDGGAEVTVITGGKGAAIYRISGWDLNIIEVSQIRTLRGAFTLLRQLVRVIRPDVIYGIEPRFEAALLSVLLLGRQRVCFRQATDSKYIGPQGKVFAAHYPKWKEFLIRYVLATKTAVRHLDDLHECHRDFQLIPEAIQAGQLPPLRGIVSSRVRSEDRTTRTVILVPFTAASIRNWPIERFVEVVDRLSAEVPDVRFVVVGDRGTQQSQLLPFQGRDNVEIVLGQTSLTDLFRIIREADLVVSSDSFAVHVASCQDVPCVALFGPNLPIWFGAEGEGSVNLYHSLECSPCLQPRGTTPCLRGFLLCPAMEQIEPEDVANHAISILNPSHERAR